MADDGGARRGSGARRKSISVKDPPAEVISGNKRHSTTVEKSKTGKADEGKGDTLPGNLAGKLQSLFTQTERAEAPALKPLRRPKLIYQNTFRLWPYRFFSNDKVRSVLEHTLEEMLGNAKYASNTSNATAMKIAEKVRGRILSFRFDRYKIIVLVHIGPLNRQGLHIAMRCLWDPMRDSYVTHTYKNPSLYCNCCVYGIYFE
ncbi:Tctex1 domain-containing protein 1-B [Orchesella cincta]|uniref:Tctex1 domain-containing protein 1-B n=1 Tax=Orchesella cincta TaxID=48709 RepID=A0A1D2MTZ6_ORCCI|nr:Tctex1 domain-containing protein 1-B [Orchesella cincta]